MPMLRFSTLVVVATTCTGAFYEPAANTAIRHIGNIGRSHHHQMMATAVAAISDDVVDRLWASSKSPLLRIGKQGAAASHANGLLDLCSSHPVVSVRLTGHSTEDHLEQLVELIAAGAPEEESPPLTLIATRKPRKGGVEALFSQAGRTDELCSVDYHNKADAAAKEVADSEAADAITFKAERAAQTVREAARLDKAGSKRGRPRMHRRAGKPLMMAKASYKTVGELEGAIKAYIAELPEGALDDPTLPSPLNYKELNFNGRPDLVEGCMAHGGYLKLSNELGIPVRIGVERPESAKSKTAQAVNEQGKKTMNLFNMFGQSG